MITITLPVWLVWLVAVVFVLGGISNTLSIMIHYRKAEIEQLKLNRVKRQLAGKP